MNDETAEKIQREPTKRNLQRARHILNHYEKTSEADTVALAKRLDKDDYVLEQMVMAEYGWLIEHPLTTPHRWLGYRYQWDEVSLEWTEDVSKAWRFARKEYAEAFAYLHREFCGPTNITKHQFGLGDE